MPGLIVGPMLRYVSETEATVFVETDAACDAEVLGARASTFAVEGHHYALVQIEGLEPGSTIPYELHLDGDKVWPPPDYEFPAPAIRTFGGENEKIEVAFGSCRVALPHQPPYTLNKDDDDRGREFDALYVLAREMLGKSPEDWPDLLLMLGDQVYVDEGSIEARKKIRERRDTSEQPGEEVADFEEYTWLYHESWRDPLIRWLFSTVSSSMIIDDHDVHDDWNISRAWVEEMRGLEWWDDRITGAFMSYWVYQHIGNLSPQELADSKMFAEVAGADDAGRLLRDYAERSDRQDAGTRWSFYRDLGRTRLIVMDSRAGRVLEEDRRSIFDDHEWEWITEHTRGDFDHLLIGTSDPFLMTKGFHYLEAWNEQVADGVWGAGAAKLAERMRRSVDFDHWPSFKRSFAELTELLREVGAGKRGTAPASIVVLSGDVHHAYLAEAAFRRSDRVRSAVWQAVVSPMRNSLDRHERLAVRASGTALGGAVARLLARSAGVHDPDLRWRLREGAHFDNQIGTLIIEGRRAAMKLEKTNPTDEQDERRLETTFEHGLTPR
ncbi:MAG: alkaline phosphatase D family protein [Solirubrobacterales bacterium]